MLIIAGFVEVPEAQRDSYVAAFRDLLDRARRAPGCLDGAITADPLNPARVNVYERWESWDHVHAWRAVANAPDLDIPFLTADVQAYEIANVRPPFD
ncbi:antibiotic biosynthesis monooxygenase [Pseudonocardiaceae bacterium YIM PH 21723]|nr:antibiotic biosynthesis monooxygenase [Pseudonocardiaceae bacterium YIM PH 21723]